MREIEIRTRLKPFSHKPGIQLILPRSGHLVQAYPSMVLIDGQEYPLPHVGAVKNFTVVEDLEHGCVTVFSRSYCYHLFGPKLSVAFPSDCTPYTGPRYDFGVTKKQDWEKIKVRADIREYLPYWHRLGFFFSHLSEKKVDPSGTFALLKQCEERIASHQPEHLEEVFTAAFKACFGEMMVPRLLDDDHTGVLPSNATASTSDPKLLFTYGAKLIRSLFLSTEGEELTLLPNLPPQLYAGRIVDESFSLGKISLRWQSKRLRMVILDATKSGPLQLHLPPSIKRYRLHDPSDQSVTWCERGTQLAISSSRRYVLDRFER